MARTDDEITFGLRAGLAVCAARPGDVKRVLFSRDVRHELEALGGEPPAGAQVRECDDDELARIAGTDLHEGLVVLAAPRAWAAPKELGDLLLEKRGVAVAFDRVRNPYNVGAILRSAAFFGADAALFGPMAPAPTLAGGAVRVAEGGVEHLVLSRSTDLGGTLAKLRGRGVHVVGADGRAETRAFGHRFTRPVVLVVGNEREGLSRHVRDACETFVAIPGSGAVESLNVSIATSLLLAEALRPLLLHGQDGTLLPRSGPRGGGAP